jgi:hypothetical protein
MLVTPSSSSGSADSLGHLRSHTRTPAAHRTNRSPSSQTPTGTTSRRQSRRSSSVTASPPSPTPASPSKSPERVHHHSRTSSHATARSIASTSTAQDDTKPVTPRGRQQQRLTRTSGKLLQDSPRAMALRHQREAAEAGNSAESIEKSSSFGMSSRTLLMDGRTKTSPEQEQRGRPLTISNQLRKSARSISRSARSISRSARSLSRSARSVSRAAARLKEAAFGRLSGGYRRSRSKSIAHRSARQQSVLRRRRAASTRRTEDSWLARAGEETIHLQVDTKLASVMARGRWSDIASVRSTRDSHDLRVIIPAPATNALVSDIWLRSTSHMWLT